MSALFYPLSCGHTINFQKSGVFCNKMLGCPHLKNLTLSSSSSALDIPPSSWLQMSFMSDLKNTETLNDVDKICFYICTYLFLGLSFFINTRARSRKVSYPIYFKVFVLTFYLFKVQASIIWPAACLKPTDQIIKKRRIIFFVLNPKSLV